MLWEQLLCPACYSSIYSSLFLPYNSAMSLSDLSFDSAISSQSSVLPISYLAQRFRPLFRPSQGSQMTVRSLLSRVAEKQGDGRKPVKAHQRIRMPETRLNDEETERKLPQTEEKRVIIVPKEPYSLPSPPKLTVHNINREVQLFSKLASAFQPRQARIRPQSEVRSRLDIGARAAKDQSPSLIKVAIRGSATDRRSAASIHIQGSRCSYSHRSSVSMHPEPSLASVRQQTASYSPVRPSSALRSLLRGRPVGSGLKGMRKSVATASFTVFEIVGLKEAGKKAYHSFERSRSSRGLPAN